MTGQIAAWHAEHLNFARLLRLFEAQLANFADDASPDYDLMRDIVYYLNHFPDLHHHRYENEVFVRMGERDARLKPLANRLLQEHRVIAVHGADLLAQLEAIVDGAIVARGELEAAAATFLTYYRAHLDAEESTMLPRAADLLQPSDWVEVAALVAEKSRDDPLFGRASEDRFRQLRLKIESEVGAMP